jgi:hypothetical protein
MLHEQVGVIPSAGEDRIIGRYSNGLVQEEYGVLLNHKARIRICRQYRLFPGKSSISPGFNRIDSDISIPLRIPL